MNLDQFWAFIYEARDLHIRLRVQYDILCCMFSAADCDNYYWVRSSTNYHQRTKL